MKNKPERNTTKQKFHSHSLKGLVNVSVSVGITAALLICISYVSAQKNPVDVQATDFVLDVVALYLNVEETDEALEVLERLRATFPDDYDLKLYLGVALCKKHDYDAAFKEFQEIENMLNLRISGKLRRYFAFSYKNRGLLHFGRGISLLFAKEDFKAAKSKFISAIKKKYDETNARYLLIYSCLKLKDFKRADKELDNLLEKKEMDEKDYILKGYLDYNRGLEEKAVSSFKKALEINPGLIQAQKSLARISYNRGEWEDAIEIWSSVIDKIPEDFECGLNMGRAYFHLGRLEEAKQQFGKLHISVPVEKYSPWKIPLALSPMEDWTKFNVEYQVDYEDLIKKKNLENLKAGRAGPHGLAAFFLNEKALVILRTEGKIDEAIKILLLAHGIDETGFIVSYNLGQLYFNSGDLKKAEKFALEAAQNKQNFLGTHDLLGNIYFKQGRYEEALEEFSRVIEISESDAQGHYNLGCAFFELKDLKNAEEEWKKATQYAAQTPIKEKEEKYSRDERGYSLIVRKRSVAYRARISLGSLYERKNFIEEAIREHGRAVKLEPNNPEAYFELGRIYFKQKSWEKARFYLEKHIDLGGLNQEEARRLLKSLGGQ
jgi:tetratricopeptide (TPR) repeat protein